jgi:hypothetical protein
VFRRLRNRANYMRTIATLLRTAEEIARRDGGAEPAAEHLVLSALGLADGTARAAFERVGADPDAFGPALRDEHERALASVGVHADEALIGDRLPEPPAAPGVYRSDPSARQLFQLAGGDARAEGGGLLGAHVIRAAATLEHGTTARALRAMGVDPDALRAAAEAEIRARAGG